MEGRTVIYLEKRKITVKKPLLISGKKSMVSDDYRLNVIHIFFIMYKPFVE